MRITGFTAVLLAAALGVATAGAAQDNPNYLPSEMQRAWQGRLDAAQERILRARGRLEASEGRYSRARSRGYPRGDALAQIEREKAEAEKALADARGALDALLDEARRAGVLPEALRPYRDRNRPAAVSPPR